MIISVVIIAYNLERFISEAISSVLNQTVKPDEIIVIDDCSTDNTAAVIKTFSKEVIYYKMPRNSGALLAALEGARRSKGEVVCMLDGDDVWAENKIEVVKEQFAGNSNLILLSHNHIRVNAAGVQTNVSDETHANIKGILQKSKSTAECSNLLQDSILAQKGYWLGSAYSFRRDAFDIEHFEVQLSAYGIEKLKYTYLDLVIAPYLVLTNKDKQVGYTDKTYFLYRIHANGSLSNNSTVDNALKSVRKGKDINELIFHILLSNNADQKYIAHRKLLLSEYDYLHGLYCRKYFHSLKTFIRLGNSLWDAQKRRKELIRLVTIFVVGPTSFLKLKSKKAFK